jgi:Repeat of unknown function (DUF5907)
MAHTPVSNVDPGDFGKASWADLVRAADLDLTDRVEDLEAATGSGSVTGPAGATDNAIPRFAGTTGTALQNSGITIAYGATGTLAGSNSGDVTLAGTPTYLTIAAQVITRALIDLTAHVTGRLPWANVVQVTAGRLLGRASASGTGNAEELTLGTGLAWNGTAIDCTVATPPSTETGSRVISGGEIVWISAYTFNVSAATYVITGTQYTSAEQSVALTAADVTNDRIDVIAVDDTGTVVAIAGTPAAQPSEPDIDPSTQLKLGIVFVAASSSAPTTTVESLYAENTGGPGEWNWTTSGSGFTLGSTTNPHAGTKDIEGTTVAAGAYALAAKPSGTLDITTYSLLVFYIRSKVTWNNNRSLQIQFRNAGVLVGSPVTFKHNTYGFDSTNLTSYQQIAIPITAFAIPAATLIDQIRLMDAGGSIGFYLDDVSLQSGGSTNVTGGITQAQADARYTQRANNLSDVASAATARGNLSAAPKTPSFVTLATDTELTNERVLTAGTGITLTDGGAGGALTVAALGGGITQLTGEVTAGPGSGSQAATIPNDTVTYAKMQNVSAASKLLGRGSAGGSGDVQEITISTGLTLTGTTLTAAGSGGDVVGPAASVDAEIALFDSTTGKLLKRLTGTGFVRAASGVASVSKLKRTVGLIIGDGTNVISTGVQGFVSCPVAGTITKARLLSSDASVTSGSIVVDVWKDTYANYPPVVGDSITASAKPTISSTTKAEDSTLTGWTTSVSAGDVFGFNVDSVTSLKRVTVELTIDE